MELTERQRRERDYHHDFAARHAGKIDEPIGLEILRLNGRRWWNSYWKLYDFVLDVDLKGKRACVPGCGFGSDAIRLAALGADVFASDVSPDLVEMARLRAKKTGFGHIQFDCVPAENTGYASGFFDLALFTGVFHHIDVPSALTELRRIMKPGGTVIAHEVYSHTSVQFIRKSKTVERIAYSMLSEALYKGRESYITDDEAKLSQKELDLIVSSLDHVRIEYCNMAQGRLFPSTQARLAKIDQRALKALGPFGRFVAGRVVLTGQMRK